MNSTVQTGGYSYPILYTDFNMLGGRDGKRRSIAAAVGAWDLRVGQRVVLAEHGDTVYCHGIVVNPDAFKGSLTDERYAYVEPIPETWGHYDEPMGDEE